MNVVAKPTSALFAGRIVVREDHHTTVEAASTHPAGGAAWALTWARDERFATPQSVAKKCLESPFAC